MTTGSLDQRFADAMGQALGPDFPTDIGLAVSGGGDSMAMLTLAHNWARVWGVKLWVVTVDHGLRAESAAEAAMVKEECAALGHPHATLRWHWDGKGNLQAAAREARLDLIDRWRGVLRHVLFAHTRDDVAETFLTRLTRSSGVEGLSAMAARREIRRKSSQALQQEEYDGDLPEQFEPGRDMMVRYGSYILHRPCLDMSRAELRHYLKTLQGRWVEDPSNDDPRFDRVRARKALSALADVGIAPTQLAETADRMKRASEALRARAASVWKDIGEEGRVRHTPTGELLFERAGFEATERETQLRLLSYALAYVSSQKYRPRETPLDALLERLLGGGKGTLHGCEVHMEAEKVRVFREYAAVQDIELVKKDGDYLPLWDGRWRMKVPSGGKLRALGEDGWAQIDRDALPGDAPRFTSARSLPSVWDGETLLACDALGVGQGHPSLWPMGRQMYSFKGFLLSH